ncbi:MAG: (deoxy)nucleoside triphosphate pyrophosphohydrolase [Mobilitalea sp.]
MKTIEVVAAIIIKDDKILATKRGYGEFINMWEFPGGKIEVGETKETALIREIEEELLVLIDVKEFLCTIDYDYPNFHLTMHCFICQVENGKLTLVEHNDAKWLEVNDLSTLEWLPADLSILISIKDWFQANK